jgi:hypothetical protein
MDMTSFPISRPQYAPLKPTEQLRNCPRWPTMQWLPRETIEVLDRCLRILVEEGANTTRVELVCSLVLDCTPDDPSLAEELRVYKARYGRARPLRKNLRGVPLMLRMPSPITLRLDLLVDLFRRRGQRTYRHEVIGTLISSAPSDLSRLEKACVSYRRAQAKHAGVQGHPLRRVLTQERPRPGARSPLG